MTAGITCFDLRYPDDSHWATWTPGDGCDAVASELSLEVATTSEGAALLRRSILAVNASSLEQRGAVAQNALWVPDRSTGEPKGIVDVTIIGFTKRSDATPEAFLARSWRREHGGWRVKVTQRSTEIVQCPAGPAVVESVVGRLRRERTVQAYSSFVIFPADGTPEAVCLRLNTIHLDLLVELTAHGRTIADSLQITTGPATP